MAGVLSDSTIKNLQSQGFMIAEGIEPDSIQPASIDLRVGGVRLEYDHDEYTIGQGIDESTVKKVEFEQLTLEPKQAYQTVAEIAWDCFEGANSSERCGRCHWDVRRIGNPIYC